METTRKPESYDSILRSLLALKREVEGAGETKKHEAEVIDEIVVSLRTLQMQSSDDSGQILCGA
jgi:hypothetical protein